MSFWSMRFEIAFLCSPAFDYASKQGQAAEKGTWKRLLMLQPRLYESTAWFKSSYAQNYSPPAPSVAMEAG